MAHFPAANIYFRLQHTISVWNLHNHFPSKASFLFPENMTNIFNVYKFFFLFLIFYKENKNLLLVQDATKFKQKVISKTTKKSPEKETSMETPY